MKNYIFFCLFFCFVFVYSFQGKSNYPAKIHTHTHGCTLIHLMYTRKTFTQIFIVLHSHTQRKSIRSFFRLMDDEWICNLVAIIGCNNTNYFQCFKCVFFQSKSKYFNTQCATLLKINYTDGSMISNCVYVCVEYLSFVNVIVIVHRMKRFDTKNG